MKWDWANVPVPPQHLVGLAIGVLLHWRLADRLFPKPVAGRIIGFGLVAIGISLAAWSVWEAGEVDLGEHADLITTGPYAKSRNPMYLAWMLLFAGIGLALNSFWMIVLLPFITLYTHYFDVLNEEQALEERFGHSYQRYRSQTRRYL